MYIEFQAELELVIQETTRILTLTLTLILMLFKKTLGFSMRMGRTGVDAATLTLTLTLRIDQKTLGFSMRTERAGVESVKDRLSSIKRKIDDNLSRLELT
jgi:hypothetical protein